MQTTPPVAMNTASDAEMQRCSFDDFTLDDFTLDGFTLDGFTLDGAAPDAGPIDVSGSPMVIVAGAASAAVRERRFTIRSPPRSDPGTCQSMCRRA